MNYLSITPCSLCIILQIKDMISREKKICNEILIPSTIEKTLPECYANTLTKKSSLLKTEFSKFLNAQKYEGE